MSITAYPTLRLKLTMPTALKLQFLPAVPGFNASQVANKVNRTGDTMSGRSFLAADPTFNLEAATKQYVDTHSGGGAPVDAEYITSTASVPLTNERVLTDTATVTWDRATSGQIKANTVVGGGNVSNSGTPAVGQVALWTDATHIQGVSSTANQMTARSNIYAAPLDALAYNGMQINGAMEVSQELGTTARLVGTGGYLYALDGWKVYNGSAAGIYTQQFAGGPSGFANQLVLTVTPATATLAAGDTVQLLQSIEGYRVSKLGWGAAGAQPITIGFWTAHH